jgi:hypothetical protein
MITSNPKDTHHVAQIDPRTHGNGRPEHVLPDSDLRLGPWRRLCATNWNGASASRCTNARLARCWQSSATVGSRCVRAPRECTGRRESGVCDGNDRREGKNGFAQQHWMSPVETGSRWIASMCLTPRARRSTAHPPFERNVTAVTEVWRDARGRPGGDFFDLLSCQGPERRV